MEPDRARQLLMAQQDGELLDEERDELEAALAASPELRAERRRLQRVSDSLAGLRLRDPADEVLESLQHSVMARTGLHAGWFFAGGGALVLFAWAVISVLVDPQLSLFFRASAGGLLLGLSFLFAVKLRERIVERRHDPYRHVIR